MSSKKRPELSGPPEEFYDAKEAAKYTSSSRIINVQKEIADRCIELLNIPPGERRLLLDIGCGSGLSGAALEDAGHAWIGCDISPDMLRIASDRVEANDDDDDDGSDDDGSDDDDDDDEKSSAGSEEEMMDESFAPPRKRARRTKTAELVQHDMGLGLPFKDGTFDGAISVSALQWLCYDNSSKQSAPKRLARFFGSLYRCLKRTSRAALQFYPQDDQQSALVAAAAARAGFAGGVVVDFPNSARARKHYLCLSMDRAYHKPSPKLKDDDQVVADQHHQRDKSHVTVAAKQRGERHHKACKGKKKKKKKDRDWVIAKKEFQRAEGRDVRPDTKFSGRKRKDRF